MEWDVLKGMFHGLIFGFATVVIAFILSSILGSGAFFIMMPGAFISMLFTINNHDASGMTEVLFAAIFQIASWTFILGIIHLGASLIQQPQPKKAQGPEQNSTPSDAADAAAS